MSQPVDVVHARTERTVTITWDDGTTSRLPIHYLRGWCPCAACQGHGAEVRYRDFPPELGIDAMDEAGSYALHIRFTDGHDSGIYSWAWLRKIAPETVPVGFKRGVFRGGHFVLGTARSAT